MKLFLAEMPQTITIISAIAIVLFLGVIVSLRKKEFNAKVLAFAAISIGLSFALSFVKVFSMPYGGAITIASMVPLIIYSYMFGFKEGLFAGLIYGLLQFIAGPYFLTPIQFMLDYLLAFTSIAMAGLVGIYIKDTRKSLPIGTGAVYVVRLIVHILAGYVFYSSIDSRSPDIPIGGATVDMSGFVYSFLYNATYLIPDMIIAIIVIILLVSQKPFVNMIDKVKLESSVLEEDTSDKSEN